MLFASAVPRSVGVRSSVVAPFASAPVAAPTSSKASTITGFSASLPASAIVRRKMSAAGLRTSLLPTWKSYCPALSCAVSIDQLPFDSARVLPRISHWSAAFLTNSQTMLPGSAMPFSVGRLSSVTAPNANSPCAAPTLSAPPVM